MQESHSEGELVPTIGFCMNRCVCTGVYTPAKYRSHTCAGSGSTERPSPSGLQSSGSHLESRANVRSQSFPKGIGLHGDLLL